MFLSGNKKILVGFAIFVLVLSSSPVIVRAAEIEVGGIFLDEKGGVALVNDAMVVKGDKVEGAEIVSISKEGVTFTQDGQEFFKPLRAPNPLVANKSTPKVQARVVSGKSSSELPEFVPSVSPVASSSSSSGPMKTLFGIPTKQIFGDPAAVKKEIQDSMPTRDPAVMMQRADDLKAKADAHRADIEKRVKEMEDQ